MTPFAQRSAGHQSSAVFQPATNSIRPLLQLTAILLTVLLLAACTATDTAPTAVSEASATPVDLVAEPAVDEVAPTPAAAPVTAEPESAAETVVQPPTLTPIATVQPDVSPATVPPAATPTTVPPDVTPETVPPASLVRSGLTAEGAFFYGNPDAPVTIIDYSDFL